MSNRETPAQLERGKPVHRKALFLRAMDVLLRETGAILSRENVFPKRRTSDGFYFLRKRFIQTQSGKTIIRLHPKALADERRTLRALARLVREGRRTMHDVQVHYQSWIASASYAGEAPIREMDKFYTVTFRQKPVYKLKRRHLHGNCSHSGGADPRA